jgi:uncharacterized RDD family membrane protein YckC
LLGAIIDASIAGLAGVVVWAATGSELAGLVATLVVSVAYPWYYVARDGQTIGKRAMATRVVMIGCGSQPSGITSLVRASVAQLPGFVIPLYALVWAGMTLGTRNRRGPHDRIGKTIVVAV